MEEVTDEHTHEIDVTETAVDLAAIPDDADTASFDRLDAFDDLTLDDVLPVPTGPN